MIRYILYAFAVACLIGALIYYQKSSPGPTAQENYRAQQERNYQTTWESKRACESGGGLFTLRQKIGEDGLPVVVTWDCKSF